MLPSNLFKWPIAQIDKRKLVIMLMTNMDVVSLLFGSLAAVVSLLFVGNKLRVRAKDRTDAERRRKSEPTYTPPTVDQVPQYVARLHAAFASGKTLPLRWRLEQLHQLRNMILFNRDEIIAAVRADLGKQLDHEVIPSEINLVLTELNDTIRHLRRWAKPQRVYTPLTLQPASSVIRQEPKGAVLIISPWNYPVNLALVPLIGAIAAGNCVFLKLSRHSKNTGETLARLIPRYLDTECIFAENEGGQPMITALIEERWDHVFFTGSVTVGRVVYQAAAKHLCPCTLELGGKNPCIVDDTIDLSFAARRIAWGKLWNCGQTCIGVDHVLVLRSVKDRLIEELKRAMLEFYGPNPKQSQSYPRIISEAATKRLANCLRDGDVVFGGDVDIAEKYVAPTILDNVKLDSPTMTDEIFGPVLPIVTVESVDEAVRFVNERPLPLALYIFTRNKQTAEFVLSRTRSGGCAVNDVILHFTNSHLPFGGVGNSGLGTYHGKLTFDTFTHKRACVVSTSHKWLDLPVRYAPYTSFKTMLVDLFTKSGY